MMTPYIHMSACHHGHVLILEWIIMQKLLLQWYTNVTQIKNLRYFKSNGEPVVKELKCVMLS